MNQELNKIYTSKWMELSIELTKIINDDSKVGKPTNPLLILLKEEAYMNSDIKIMIFGQETNDWEKDFKCDINVPLNTYNYFFNSLECFSYGGHFWNGYNKFLQLLQIKYPDKKIYSIWNNIIKIGNSGRNKNCPPDYIYNIEMQKFKVIKAEIDILKPDVILFLTGPNYDDKIVNTLENPNFFTLNNKYSKRQLARIDFESHKNMFRTYHPNYLWRNGIDNYFNAIIEKINL